MDGALYRPGILQPNLKYIAARFLVYSIRIPGVFHLNSNCQPHHPAVVVHLYHTHDTHHSLFIYLQSPTHTPRIRCLRAPYRICRNNMMISPPKLFRLTHTSFPDHFPKPYVPPAPHCTPHCTPSKPVTRLMSCHFQKTSLRHPLN